MNKTITRALIVIFCLSLGGIMGYLVHEKINDRIAMAYFVEGYDYFEEKKYNEAIKMLNRSIGLDPDFMLSHYYLSASYEKVGLYDLMKEEDSLDSKKAGHSVEK